MNWTGPKIWATITHDHELKISKNMSQIHELNWTERKWSAISFIFSHLWTKHIFTYCCCKLKIISKTSTQNWKHTSHFFSYQTQLYGQKHFSPVYWTISREKKLNSIIHYNCLRIIVVVFSSCYTLESKSNSLQTSAQTKITYSSISNPKLTRINSSSIYPISVMSLLSNFKVQTKTYSSLQFSWSGWY